MVDPESDKTPRPDLADRAKDLGRSIGSGASTKVKSVAKSIGDWASRVKESESSADYVVALIRAMVGIIVVIVWAIVGFVFWIPLLARTTALFTVASLQAHLQTTTPSVHNKHLEHAILFYVDGFRTIVENVLAAEPSRGGQAAPMNVVRLLAESTWTLMFWWATIMALGPLSSRAMPLVEQMRGPVVWAGNRIEDLTSKGEHRYGIELAVWSELSSEEQLAICLIHVQECGTSDCAHKPRKSLDPKFALAIQARLAALDSESEDGNIENPPVAGDGGLGAEANPADNSEVDEEMDDE